MKTENQPPRLCAAAGIHPSDRSGDFVGTETTGTNRNGLRRTVYHGLDSSDIGLPGSVGFSVGVGHIVTEHNAFTANTAFCHDSHTSCIDLFRNTPWRQSGIKASSESDTYSIIT